MVVLVGTSGWQYRDWRDAFYGATPQRTWLQAYVEQFQTVEVNNAFYRLPERSTFQRWHDGTPDDFVFAVKMSRYLSHVKRLKDPAEPVKRFLDRSEPLADKLGPVLIQLPPTLKLDANSLKMTLAQFPKGVRVAFEPRHDSWFCDEVRELLERHNASLCWADRPGLKMPFWQTADWGYVRLHEGKATPRPCYGRAALHTWAERIANVWTEIADVFVYFNNDTNGCALRDAGMLSRELQRVDYPVTRYVPPSLIALGPYEQNDASTALQSASASSTRHRE